MRYGDFTERKYNTETISIGGKVDEIKKGIFSALEDCSFKRIVMIDVGERHMIGVGNGNEFYKFNICNDEIEIQYNGSNVILKKLKKYFGDKDESNI